MPKQAGKIVLHSLPDLEDGALAVLTGLRSRGRDALILTESRATARLRTVEGMAIRAVPKNTLRGRFHFLTAELVITTHGAVFRRHRSSGRQVTVNIWHGESLTKPVGRWADDVAVHSTWTTALSNVGKAFRCAEFDLAPQQVLVTGAPRNDRLLRADRDSVRQKVLGADVERRLYIWLPTYRAHARNVRTDGVAFEGAVPLGTADAEGLDRWLIANDALLLAKPHPLAARSAVGRFERICTIDEDWLAARGLTLYTLLMGVDALVTDVSSVWVDFLLADRPVLFVFPDIDEYRQNRGLQLEPYEAWVPGPLLRTGAQLVEQLEQLQAGTDLFVARRQEAKQRLHRYTDAGSTSRLLDALGL